ncbi:hypothetical protein [Mesorhizobium sp. 10J20-29]
MERKVLNACVVRAVGIAVLVIAAALTGPSYSQEVDCSCRGPAGAKVTISKADGEVLVTRAAGFEPATVGSTLPLGSRVIVGRASSATIKLSESCKLDLAEYSEADVTTDNQQICLAKSASEPAPGSDVAGGAGFSVGPPETLFLGLAAGAVVLSVFDENKAVSD